MKDQFVWLSILLIAFVCSCSGRHERRDGKMQGSLHSKPARETDQPLSEEQIIVTGSDRNTNREIRYQKQVEKSVNWSYFALRF